ncbi:MAG: peptide-methionine (R)-S-oxide reductase MsrB [Candidatus Pacebacteria bacterium]|nr:peptide-methionine (R)-S-oxide reductase MsrB [Candidatus Paceibacterota bacterium]
MRTILIIAPLVIIVIATGVYHWHQERKSNTKPRSTDTAVLTQKGLAVATFAGGCFWCTESDFEKTMGVVDAVSGYTGGNVDNPTYHQVSAGETGHREAVQVYYDPAKVSYEQLLEVFWRHIDPTDEGGQFADRGFQYSSAILYTNDSEKAAAEASRDGIEKLGILSGSIKTPIIPFSNFYIAEDYHQNYHTKNPLPYEYYRNGSGRNAYIEKTWGDSLKKAQQHDAPTTSAVNSTTTIGTSCAKPWECFTKPSDDTLQKQLSPLQYSVTQEEDTERAFSNEYWNNHADGIYVDIVSGEPLFSSKDKFDSGTGWPSFTKPLNPKSVELREDNRFLLERTEVRSRLADSHLGHLFNDAPAELGGIRYCMNSASLRFIPKSELVGPYAEYAALFK